MPDAFAILPVAQLFWFFSLWCWSSTVLYLYVVLDQIVAWLVLIKMPHQNPVLQTDIICFFFFFFCLFIDKQGITTSIRDVTCFGQT